MIWQLEKVITSFEEEVVDIVKRDHELHTAKLDSLIEDVKRGNQEIRSKLKTLSNSISEKGTYAEVLM